MAASSFPFDKNPLMKRWLGNGDAQAESAPRRRRKNDAEREFCRLRPVPNEHIYFYVKSIDNSRAVPAPDPKAPKQCWSTITTSFIVVLVMIGILLPGAYTRLAGYQLDGLKKQREQLMAERTWLDAQIAQSKSMKSLDHFAQQNSMKPAAAGLVQHLQGDLKGTEAILRRNDQNKRAGR